MTRSQATEDRPVDAGAGRKGNGAAKPSVFDQFVTDEALEQEGVWRVVDGWRFKIMRANNPRHAAIMAKIAEPTLRAYENGELDDAEQRKVLGQLVGEGLLADWDDRFSEPFSPATARELVERAPHLGHRIAAIAAGYENYLRRDRERDSKN